VRQTIVEDRLLKPIKTELLTDEKLEALRRRVAQKVAAAPKPANPAPRIAQLRRQIENLTDAIATGALKASPALSARLTVAEEELDQLTAQAAKPASKVVDLRGRIMARFKTMAKRLEEYFARDPHRARAALREICGEIPVFPHEPGKFLVAKLGLSELFLRAAVGSEKFVVAGA
jgi:hypothetical protein